MLDVLVSYLIWEAYLFLILGALSQLHDQPGAILRTIGIVCTALVYCMALVPWGMILWAWRKTFGPPFKPRIS